MPNHTINATVAAALLATFGWAGQASAQCSPTILNSLDPPGTSWDTEIQGDILYFCDGEQGLRVYLIDEDPLSLTLLNVLPIPAYSIAVDGTIAYVTSGWIDIGGDDLQVVDVSNPSAPALLGTVALPGDPPLIRPSQVVASGGFAYVGISFSAAIIDARVPTAPVVVGTVGDGETPRIALDGDVLFLPQFDGAVHAWDVSDPFAPVDIGQAPAGFSHRAATISGDHLYFTGNSFLAVVDISDPTNMTSAVITSGPVSGNNVNIAVVGGVGYMIEANEFFVLDLSTPMEPAMLGTTLLPTSDNFAAFVAVKDGHAFLSQAGDDAHYIVDVSSCPRPPLITLQPQSVLADAGGPDVSFSISASFVTDIQWRLNGEALAEGGPFSGVNTTTLTVAPGPDTEGLYDAVVSNEQGSIISSTAGLVIVNSCPADINGDGDVGPADLAALLDAWGLCP